MSVTFTWINSFFVFLEIELQTYNVALFNGELGRDRVPRKTRRWQVTNAIRDSTADVLCLQEVFYEDDMRYVRAGLFENIY